MQAQQRPLEDDQLIEQQLQTDSETERSEDEGAEQEALQAVAQQAGEAEEIPAQEASAEELTTQGQSSEKSATEEALGEEEQATPIFGFVKKLFGGGKKKDETGKPETAETETGSTSTTKTETGKTGPWTTKTIASLVADNTAGVAMRQLAARDTKNGIALLKSSGAWDKLLKALPKGDALAAGTKAALYKMVKDRHVGIADAKALFEIRFKHPAKDDSGTWTMDSLDLVWKQLDHLPENDVSKNTIWSTFYAIAGGGGFYTWTDIKIGVGGSAKHMEHTVRHEVGHGVHHQIKGQVDPWLKNDMSFWYSAADDSGLETWIQGLGGYPEKYKGPDGKDHNFDDNAKKWVRSMIKKYTGSSSWDPLRATPDATEGAWPKAMWKAMPDAVKNACTQSNSHWYNNWRNFQKGTDGKRYFLNHWYKRAYTIGNVAATAIEATGENYTAMSEMEFFANCYAEYFADPAGKEDNTKWGGKLPSSVKGYFQKCIVDRHPYTDYAESLKKKNT